MTWHWAFWINIPVGIAAFAVAWFALTLPSKKATKRIDVLGVALLSATTACLVFFTEFGGNRQHGWGAPETWAWGAGFLIAAALFVYVESRAQDPIIPLSFFRNRTFVTATAIGFVLGLGMFAAIGFVPTFLQMASGTSAAVSGLLMLPMMVGLIGTSIVSGTLITKTGRYRAFPVIGTIVVGIAMLGMTTLAASTPIWLICVYLFVFGAGLGLIMQVVVLVAQNAVPPEQVGTATSTNNYFREVGASLGVAVFGALFTSRLTDALTDVFRGAGGSASQAASASASIDPTQLAKLPQAVQDGIVNAYADSLSPVFWYLLPFIAVAFVLALFIPQMQLADVAGMVARGEAVGGTEADELERSRRAGAGVAPGASWHRASRPSSVCVADPRCPLPAVCPQLPSSSPAHLPDSERQSRRRTTAVLSFGVGARRCSADARHRRGRTTTVLSRGSARAAALRTRDIVEVVRQRSCPSGRRGLHEPSDGSRQAPVLARGTSRVGSAGSGASVPSSVARSRSAAARPSSAPGSATLVRAGAVTDDDGRSSKPATARVPGTAMSRSAATRSTPYAKVSAAPTTAVTPSSSQVSTTVPTAVAAASIVRSARATTGDTVMPAATQASSNRDRRTAKVVAREVPSRYPTRRCPAAARWVTRASTPEDRS
jgi:predicted MFS family arabinose efflux permease